VSSQAASDAGFLQYLAEETGGTFCNLLNTSPESAAKGFLPVKLLVRWWKARAVRISW
jgi:hypothetical protein